MKMSKNVKKITIREEGETLFGAFTNTFSKLGGLFTSLCGVCAILEAYLTKSELIGTLTQRLFLTKRYG